MSLARLERLRTLLRDHGLSVLMVSQAENRRYLSGFTGSSGTLFISLDDAVLVTDFRYLEQAELQAPGFRIVRVDNQKPYEVLRSVAAELSSDRVAVEADHLSVAQWQDLGEALAASHLQLEARRGLVESLRTIKDPGELGYIEHAVSLADAALDHVAASVLRPGLTERAVAWEIERFLRENGADAIAFDTIIASGPNAALPHHRAGARTIERGEPVIIDMGALLDGYRSDVTRTLWCGRPEPRLAEIYNIVLDAQEIAASWVRAGMGACDADALARDHIASAGFAEAFGHSLGHGIGLAVHEAPLLGKFSDEMLCDNMVFSIEPGIYLPGWGGVRIEDLVVLQNGQPRTLTHARKSRHLA